MFCKKNNFQLNNYRLSVLALQPTTLGRLIGIRIFFKKKKDVIKIRYGVFSASIVKRKGDYAEIARKVCRFEAYKLLY